MYKRTMAQQARDMADIKRVIDGHLKAEGVMPCRFVLLVTVNEKGGTSYANAGSLSGLELAGMNVVLPDIINEITEELEKEDGETNL